MKAIKTAMCRVKGCKDIPYLKHDGYCKNHAPLAKEASRVKKSEKAKVRGYCQ